MPAALKKPTLDELYKRLRDLDYTQVDERLAVTLNAILQLEAQGECRESATEAVLMVGYTSDGVSNREQTRWLSWNLDGSLRVHDLARNPGLGSDTEYGAGEFPSPTRPPAGTATQSTSQPPSKFRSQQTEESYPDLGIMKRERWKGPKGNGTKPLWIGIRRLLRGIKPSLIASRHYFSETRPFFIGIC